VKDQGQPNTVVVKFEGNLKQVDVDLSAASKAVSIKKCPTKRFAGQKGEDVKELRAFT
jgi:hypothetical protein